MKRELLDIHLSKGCSVLNKMVLLESSSDMPKKIFNPNEYVLCCKVKNNDGDFEIPYYIDSEKCYKYGILENNIEYIKQNVCIKYIETTKSYDRTIKCIAVDPVKSFKSAYFKKNDICYNIWGTKGILFVDNMLCFVVTVLYDKDFKFKKFVLHVSPDLADDYIECKNPIANNIINNIVTPALFPKHGDPRLHISMDIPCTLKRKLPINEISSTLSDKVNDMLIEKLDLLPLIANSSFL